MHFLSFCFLFTFCDFIINLPLLLYIKPNSSKWFLSSLPHCRDEIAITRFRMSHPFYLLAFHLKSQSFFGNPILHSCPNTSYLRIHFKLSDNLPALLAIPLLS